MKYARIDAFEMSFEECAVAKKYKLKSTRGMGEKRIYAGHDEEALDEFFDLDNIEAFFILKSDLVQYLYDAKDEYFNPSQEYSEEISRFYEANVHNTADIPDKTIRLHFTKKYDGQKRYYLNFKKGTDSSTNWDYLRNIALPRVTNLNFVKIKNLKDGKLYIYIKPQFFIDEQTRDTEKEIPLTIDRKTGSTQTTYRKKQVQYRKALLDIMPQCIITFVAEDRILEACHIKPYNVCNEKEKYDENNGLIMTPTFHKLFDMGFISFTDEGKLLISPFLSNLNRSRLRIKEGDNCKVPQKCAPYLKFHRENIFNQIPDLQI